MRIESVTIENFRSIRKETVDFENYTYLVGPNGSGKSTVLSALNVFFRESENTQTDTTKLSLQDFYMKNPEKAIKIKVTFGSLSEAETEDFKDYARQGKLIITAEAEYDKDQGNAVVQQYGSRLAMKEFAHYFKSEGEGALAKELKEIYAELKLKYADLPSETVKAQMASALRAYESKHPELCVELPSSDQFYGFSKGTNRLNKYVQWVYVPAVKDVTEEQYEAGNTALGKLLSRTVRAKIDFKKKVDNIRQLAQKAYRELLDENQEVLAEISESLRVRLAEWTHPGATVKVQWTEDEDKSVRISEPVAGVVAGEDSFEGDIARLGHGFQRSYMIAILQELALLNDEESPKLLLCIEEPEIYQHPPQIRHLSEVLEQLSNQDSQIITCTHNPMFITGEYMQSIRKVYKVNTETKIKKLDIDDFKKLIKDATDEEFKKDEGVFAKVHQELQNELREIFFAKKVILVEGIEDVAYLKTYLISTDRWKRFRKEGAHIIPAGGKGHFPKVMALMKFMNIPYYAMYDSDSDQDKPEQKQRHLADNKAIMYIADVKGDIFPDSNISRNNTYTWKTNITNEVFVGIDDQIVERIRNEVMNEYGNIKSSKKNVLVISDIIIKVIEEGIKIPELENLVTSLENALFDK